MKQQIIESIKQNKIIAIVRGVKKEDLIPLAEAVYKGGIKLLEITYTAGRPETDLQTAANIQRLAEHFKGRMQIGAGTVLTKRQVALTKKAGGSFIISPNVNKAVIQKANALGLVSIPGALTPTEVEYAHCLGADFVKLFPIDAMGPAYVKAVSAPLSHIPLLAVGGVSPQNIAEFAKAGACGFGIGSYVIKKDLIAVGDFDGIAELATHYVAALKEVE